MNVSDEFVVIRKSEFPDLIKSVLDTYKLLNKKEATEFLGIKAHSFNKLVKKRYVRDIEGMYKVGDLMNLQASRVLEKLRFL